ncbi:MAG TPA: hypothetical protein DCE44_16215 [Verrucomicrobiales bacterium]|nr:hypothetical protein [Verrucomicrobiales bacterium]
MSTPPLVFITGASSGIGQALAARYVDRPFIPEPLRGATHYLLDSEAGYQKLKDFLTGRSGVVPRPLGRLEVQPRGTGVPLTFPPASASHAGSQPVAQAATAAQPNPNAQAVFAQVVRRVRRALSQAPGLCTSLREELLRSTPGQAEAGTDIIDLLFTAELNDVFRAIYVWLEANPSVANVEQVRELLNGLAARGANAAWVQTVREALPKHGNALQGGHVLVPAVTDLPMAELLKSAILDAPAYWQRTGPGGFLRSEGGYDATGGIEPLGPSLSARLAEFRAHLLEKLGIQAREPDAQRKLEQRLMVRWQQGKPLYALFEADDALPAEIARHGSLPWQFLLVMQRSPAVEEILKEPYATATWLQDILDRLDRQDRNPSRSPV